LVRYKKRIIIKKINFIIRGDNCMDRPIRKAVRCYLIKDKKVVVTKYKEGNKKNWIL